MALSKPTSLLATTMVGTNPSTVKLLRAILFSRTCVPKFISTICTVHTHPMSIALWKLDASWIYSKETYKARVSYVLAYQVYIYIYINSWSSFNTIPTPIPLHSHFRATFQSWDRNTSVSTPSPYHTHTIAQSTGQLPLGTVSRLVAPSYARTLTPRGEKRRTHLTI